MRASQRVPYWLEEAYMREPEEGYDDDDYDVDAVIDAWREERAFDD